MGLAWGCANGSQSGYSCGSYSSGATVIGRSAAKASGGAVMSDSICNFGSDNFNSGSCNVDAGYDHGYRIFLRAGEKITISYSESKCAGGSASVRLKLYQTTTGAPAPLMPA